jgi:predicted dehydrogenase
MEGSLTVFGKNGTIKIGGEYLDRIDYQVIDKYVIGQLEQSREANTYKGYQGSMSNHDKMYAHVADVLAGKIPNGFTGNDGVKIVEIIERIYNSARKSNS